MDIHADNKLSGYESHLLCPRNERELSSPSAVSHVTTKRESSKLDLLVGTPRQRVIRFSATLWVVFLRPQECHIFGVAVASLEATGSHGAPDAPVAPVLLAFIAPAREKKSVLQERYHTLLLLS